LPIARAGHFCVKGATCNLSPTASVIVPLTQITSNREGHDPEEYNEETAGHSKTPPEDQWGIAEAQIEMKL
jgi:hypothetical protein